ncbi:DUF6903 family protein [Anaerorhabdus sp.]|jgi:hypothetical protein|uniref:DUF6903 family protein n=1 Tax=Anaerorhabdus sp. TaxID=1872524 RepID=UPI002FCC7757
MGKLTREKLIMMLIVFIISFALVFIGQRNTGYAGLATEVVGVIGLIFLLYYYNAQYK